MSLDPQIVFVAERTLTSAEILALNSVPIEIVPGDPNAVIWPIGAFLRYRPGSVPYVVPSGQRFALSPALNAPILDIHAEFFIDGDASVGIMADSINAAAFALVDARGTPLLLYCDGVADPTDGDGTLDITVLYRIFDIT